MAPGENTFDYCMAQIHISSAAALGNAVNGH